MIQTRSGRFAFRSVRLRKISLSLFLIFGVGGSEIRGRCLADDAPRFGPIVDSEDLSAPTWSVPDDFKVITKAAETDSIRLTASLNRSNKFGVPIDVKLECRNNRKEYIVLNHSMDAGDFYMCLFDRKGNQVPWGELGKSSLGVSLYDQTSNAPRKLFSGQSITRVYDLSQYFAIPSAGVYRLTVVRTVNGTESYLHAGKELELEISSIVFNVTQ